MNVIDKILLISIIILPGIYNGDTYISTTDIVIPIVFLWYLIKYKKIIKLKGPNIFLLIYIIICIFSIVLASILDGNMYADAWMKFLRLFYLLFIIFWVEIVFRKNMKSAKENYLYLNLYKTIMIYGIISGAVMDVLFFTQSTVFKPTQQMVFNDQVIYRASGVYGDCQTAGFMMAIVFIVAFSSFVNGNSRKISLIALVVSVSAIIISDTRAALFGIATAVIIHCIRMKKITLKIIIYMMVSVIVGWIVYNYVPFFKRVIDERMLALIYSFISGDKEAVALASTNRFDIWNNCLHEFNNYNILQMLFGTGYKVKIVTTDNNIVFSLMCTGLFGLLAFLGYWIVIYKTVLFDKVSRKNITVSLMVTMSIVFILTCDMMTLYRPMYLFISILQFSLIQRNYIRK